MNPNPDFKGTPLFDVEQISETVRGCYRLQIESDVWPIELCHCQ